MSYWMHWHNMRYEARKSAENALHTLARHLPAQLRMWVVVDAFAAASIENPARTPDELSYREVYDTSFSALR